jgi:preprotein translocase subunit SecD
MDQRRALKFSIGVLSVFLTILLVYLFLYRREPLRQYQIAIEYQTRPTEGDRDLTIDILRKRLESFADPDWDARIIPQRDGTLVLRYRKAGDPARLARDILPRGACEIRLLDVDPEHVKQAQEGGPPDGWMLMDYLESCDGYDEQTGEPIRRLYPALVSEDVLLAPDSFKDVTFETQGVAKYVHVRLEFAPEDVPALVRMAKEHPGKPIAIIVDARIRIYTRIGPVPAGGVIEIQDLLDIAEMEKLATILRTGPLPCSLRIRDRSVRELK